MRLIMSYIKIKRLNEDHNTKLPTELLNMTVGEMLDKVGKLDTANDAEYEIVEDALIAISDKILGNGYTQDEVNFTPDEGVEKEKSEIEDTEYEEDFPTFDKAVGGGNNNNSGENDSIDNFNF